MITYIELENFKSFKHIKLDLNKNKNTVKNLAFIYGENGVGKSNLVDALFFVKNSINTLKTEKESLDIKQLLDEKKNTDELDLKDALHYMRIMQDVFEDRIKEVRPINGGENTIINIGMKINGHNGDYRLVLNDNEIISEELIYLINERRGTLFKFSKNNEEILSNINNVALKSSKFRNEIEDLVQRFWGKHTFISILTSELDKVNRGYKEKVIGENLINIIRWFLQISVDCNDKGIRNTQFDILANNLNYISADKVKEKDVVNVETALNSFFASLYSDVVEVKYKKVTNNNKTSWELFFVKQINSELVEVPSRLESTGTKKILDKFNSIFMAVYGDIVVIDEMDSGIHDLLFVKLIGSIQESIEGQLIVTTHNTSIMERINKEFLYVLDSNVYGEKELICLDEFNIHKNNSIRNKYMHEAYGGVPSIGYLDLEYIVGEFASSYEEDSEEYDG